MKRLDLSGQSFGRLRVIGFSHVKNSAYWLCECACGKTTTVGSHWLKSGKTKSCGCLNRDALLEKLTTHNMSKTPEYKAWLGIVDRCTNNRKNYGDRGISVCDRWKESFESFFSDMGVRPSKSHSIDRIDVNGNYEPSNCRWATVSEQARNKRQTIGVCIDGMYKTIIEWAEIYNINYKSVHTRISRGWDIIEAIRTPLLRKANAN